MFRHDADNIQAPDKIFQQREIAAAKQRSDYRSSIVYRAIVSPITLPGSRMPPQQPRAVLSGRRHRSVHF
jgi:hypothetical protein